MIKTQELVQVLDAESLTQLIERCNDNEEYIAAIAFDYMDRCDEFISELKSQLVSADFLQIKHIQRGFGSLRGTIEFFNGSSIDIFTANSIHAKVSGRYNEILYTAVGITDRMVQEVLMPMIKPYDGWTLIDESCKRFHSTIAEKFFKETQKQRLRQIEEEEQATKALDEFLGSFTVHS